jgi:hypothetical protein
VQWFHGVTSMWFHDVTHVLPRIHLDKDGRVRSFRELICLTDEAKDVDLWQEGRQVLTLRHADKK